VFRRCRIPVERNLCILQQKQCDRGKRKVCPCAEVINHYAMSAYLGVAIYIHKTVQCNIYLSSII
jgi:hypothetical protein